MKESKKYIGDSSECKVLSAKLEARRQSAKLEGRRQKAEVLSTKCKVQSSKFRVRCEETLLERHPVRRLTDSGSYTIKTKPFVEIEENVACPDERRERQQTFAPCFSLAMDKQPNNTALAVKRNPEKKSAQFGERFRNKSGMTATIKNDKEENNIQEKMNDECAQKCAFGGIMNIACPDERRESKEKNENNANSFTERSLAIASLRGLMRGDADRQRGKVKTNNEKNNTQYSINNIQLKSLKNNTKYNILEQKDCFVPCNDVIYIRSKTKEKIYKNSFSLFFPNGGVKERELSIHLN